MSTLNVWIQVSIDAYFAGPKGEIDWFKSIGKDEEYEAFSHQQSKRGSTLLMGRTTYEMMKSFWPTPQAEQLDPQMAEVMRNSPKVVFSKTLKSLEEGPAWKNLELRHDIDRDDIVEMKKRGDLTTLGSGSVVQQLLDLDLIDEIQLVVIPKILGAGKPLFKDVRQRDAKLKDARSFGNGIVVLTYRP